MCVYLMCMFKKYLKCKNPLCYHLWFPQKAHKGVSCVGTPTSPSAQQSRALIRGVGFSSELCYIIVVMEASIQPASLWLLALRCFLFILCER